MSTITGLSDNKCCLKLQLASDEVYGAIDPAMETRDHGFLASLVSSRNTAQFAQIPTASSEGKERPTDTSDREIRVEYTSKQCDPDSYDTPKGLCATSTTTIGALKYAQYTVDLFHGFDVILTPEDYRNFCENPTQAYNRHFKEIVDSQAGKINEKLIEKASGMFGNYPKSGNNSIVAPETLNIVTSSGIANPLFNTLLKKYYTKMNRSEQPIIVGEGKLDIYADARGFSAVNDGGINGAASTPLEYFRDQDLGNVTPFDDGNDWMLTYLPGTFMFNEWYDNMGYYDSNINPDIVGNSRDERTRINVGGFTWDFYKLVDQCAPNVTFRFEKWFDVNCRIPDDAFAACQDYNYKLAFLLGCGDTTCTDIENAC